MVELILDETGYEAYLGEIQALEERLARLRKFKGEVAIYEGDAWHDNFTFEQTETEERMLMADIALRYERLSKATFVDNVASLGVDLNDVVNLSITMGAKKREMNVWVVSYKNSDDIIDEETKKTIKQVTLDSPLGQAIYQKEEGEHFTYCVGEKKFDGEIVTIKKSSSLSNAKVKKL